MLRQREGVALMLYSRWAAIDGPHNGDDIEAERSALEVVFGNKPHGGSRDARLLRPRNGFAGARGFVSSPCLDFDEHERLSALDGDQIEFTAVVAVPAGDDDQALPPEVSGG